MTDKERKYYVYGIIKERKPQKFGIVGLGGLKDRLHTIHFKDLAVVVGRPPDGRGVMTREATITHEKIIEEVMKRYAVLPLAFGVIAKATAVRKKLLGEKFSELQEALARVEGKVELNLKAFWLNMAEVFKEVAKELQVMSIGNASYAQRIAVGERVAKLIVQKKKQEAATIVAPLRDLAEEIVEKETQSERMVFDCAFLVQKKREAVFDKAVTQAAISQDRRMKFKYVLSPPYNFVNLHFNLA